jgi:hypothetical protein
MKLKIQVTYVGATSNGVTSVSDLTDIRNFHRKLFSDTNMEEYIPYLIFLNMKRKLNIITTTRMGIIK